MVNEADPMIALTIQTFGSFLVYALAFLFVITLIVFFHELGHFAVARWFGVRVEAFSIGFGRELLGFKDRHGTRWKIGWLQIGGYVKFEGDANAAGLPRASSLDEDARLSSGNFYSKPVIQRMAVVAAGPVANFILAIFIFAFLFATVGVAVNEPRVDTVLPGSVAELAGIKPGDYVLSIEGRAIQSFDDIPRMVAPRSGEELSIAIRRGDEQLTFLVVPKAEEIESPLGGNVKVGRIGIGKQAQGDLTYVRQDIVSAFRLALVETWRSMGDWINFLRRLVIGKESTSQLGGPGTIAKVAGMAASAGLYPLLHISAVLSVTLGLVNLLPIPMLDGGHLLYYVIELVRGKPLGQNAQEWGFRVGFALVVALMLLVTWNDVVRLAGPLLGLS
jgi:regulator of sigma E protease